MIASRKKPAIPLLITLVIMLLHNLSMIGAVQQQQQQQQQQQLEPDWTILVRQKVAEYNDERRAAGLPIKGTGARILQTSEETLIYEFVLTAAFAFPPGFEFQTGSPIMELRGAGRLTQLFYRRIYSQQYPESYVMCETTNDGGILPTDDFPFIILFINSTVTFRLVGDVPTLQEARESSLADNRGVADDDVWDTSPTGFDPEDYLGFIQLVQPPEIFANCTAATILEVNFQPTPEPSSSPTFASEAPSDQPSKRPTTCPSDFPSSLPSNSPSSSTDFPSAGPTGSDMPTDSIMPSITPTASPAPSKSPTLFPTSSFPSSSPSEASDPPSMQPSDVPSKGPTMFPTATPTDSSFTFTGTNQNVPSSEYDVISGAFAQMNAIVVGDITDQTTSGETVTFNPNARLCNIPRNVDDLHICISYNPDWIGTNVYGQAGVIEIRSATDNNKFLPYVSAMDLDPTLADEDMDLFQTVVRHEAMHTLGFGILWDVQYFDLVNNDGQDDCTYKVGTIAQQRFREITGCAEDFAIPLQDVNCAHWDQDCFGGREIMVPVLVEDPLPVISNVTIGSLEDMGYTVNYDGGDELTDKDFSDECMCSGGGSGSGSGSKSMSGDESMAAPGGFMLKPGISPAALAEATAAGIKYLDQMKKQYESFGGDEARTDGSSIFVGHKAVNIVIKDGNYVRSVIVRST